MNAHAVSLAVVAGSGDREKRVFNMSYGLFHGTAFCLAPHLFLTAGHVYRDAKSDGEVALARFAPGQQQAESVDDAEVFDNIDLAILRCPGLLAEIVPFHFGPLEYLTDVFSFGYPFGFEPPVWHLRAFKGHVVTRRTLNILPGHPPGYELSFVPPAGLSGAPLLTTALGGPPAVVGMVLRHHIAEFKGHQMELGLALDIEELLTIESRIVGGSLAELLFRRPRVTRGDSP